jgi:hypothetical protein
MRQAEMQRDAVTAIEKLGGRARWDDKALEGPAWLRTLLGDDFFNSARWVDLTRSEVTDAGLEHLKGLSRLQQLWLVSTKVTDAGVKKLQQALPKCRIVR